MRTRLTILLFMCMAACTSTPAQRSTTISTTQALASTPFPLTEPSPTPEAAILSAYPNLGPAPEIVGEVWLNTEAPLHLADLRGKVILIDMWTFG